MAKTTDNYNISQIAQYCVEQADPVDQMNRVIKVLESFEERIEVVEKLGFALSGHLKALSKAMREKEKE